ncbi:hypothetical protein [Escherichia coli]
MKIVIYITIFMILPCPVPCSHVFLYVFYIFSFWCCSL